MALPTNSCAAEMSTHASTRSIVAETDQRERGMYPHLAQASQLASLRLALRGQADSSPQVTFPLVREVAVHELRSSRQRLDHRLLIRARVCIFPRSLVGLIHSPLLPVHISGEGQEPIWGVLYHYRPNDRAGNLDPTKWMIT